MSLPVNWSPISKTQYANLLKFIEVEYGVDAALKFLEKQKRKLTPSGNSQKVVLPLFNILILEKALSTDRPLFIMKHWIMLYKFTFFEIIVASGRG